VFYVGKGCGNRAFERGIGKRSSYWQRVSKKYGYYVQIVKSDMEESEALSLEIALISVYKSIGSDLCNLTDGGDGKSGCIWTDESRDKISMIMSGIPKSLSHRQKLRDANSGKIQSKETINKRIETFNDRLVCKDKNTYIFYSENDVFVGTRKELSLYSGIPTAKFVKLFRKIPNKSSFGWSVLKLNELLILKEILK
jgi:hypothetical protein